MTGSTTLNHSRYPCDGPAAGRLPANPMSASAGSSFTWSASITSRRYQYVLGCGSAMEADLRRPTGNDPVPSRTPTATSFGFGYQGNVGRASAKVCCTRIALARTVRLVVRDCIDPAHRRGGPGHIVNAARLDGHDHVDPLRLAGSFGRSGHARVGFTDYDGWPRRRSLSRRHRVARGLGHWSVSVNMSLRQGSRTCHST